MFDALGGRSDVMNLAARHGFLAIVQWLHDNRVEDCTTEAMDSAALAGHMHVVQRLRVHRAEGCTEAALASTIPASYGSSSRTGPPIAAALDRPATSTEKRKNA